MSAGSFVQKSAAEHARPAPEVALASPRNPLVLVLENIRSGGNVGSVLRTADCVLAEEVLLVGYTPSPPHREILRTSLGAEASVPWRRIEDLGAVLTGFRESGYTIAALEQTSNSTALQAYVRQAASAKTVLVLGNEVRGVSAETLDLVDVAIEIEQFGAKQSFNVSVAAGIAAWAIVNGNETLGRR